LQKEQTSRERLLFVDKYNFIWFNSSVEYSISLEIGKEMSTLTFEPVRFKGVPIKKYIPTFADWLATKGATALRGEGASKFTKGLWIFAALVILTAVSLYAFSPVDLIPDQIPVVGMWDDYTVMMVAVVPVLKLLKLSFGEDINFSKWEKGFAKFGAIYSLCGLGVWDFFVPVAGATDEYVAMMMVFIPVVVFLLKTFFVAVGHRIARIFARIFHPQRHVAFK
jgi:hypothetical protein